MGLELVLWIWNFWENKKTKFRSKLNLVHNALYIHHNFFYFRKTRKSKRRDLPRRPWNSRGLVSGQTIVSGREETVLF